MFGPCHTDGDCCGPGSYCCAHTGSHTHDEIITHDPIIYPRAGHGPRMFYHDWVIRCLCGFGARVSFHDTAESVAAAHVAGEDTGTDPIDADDRWIIS